jgi:hypothetical protein
MNPKHTLLFPLLISAPLAHQAAFGQPAPITVAAPTITILSAATGALMRSQGPSNARVDLGRVSYFKGTSAPGESSRRNTKSFVISTRFGLKIDCPANTSSSVVSITVARLDSASSYVISIDGTTVAFLPQTLLPSVRCGSSSEHRLEVEVPISTPEGSIGSNVVFAATLRK